MPSEGMNVGSASQKTLRVLVIPCGTDKVESNKVVQDRISELQLDTNGENSLKTILLGKKSLW